LNQWIGLVLTIPRTLDNRRRSPERASRTTSRMTGDRSTKTIARCAASGSKHRSLARGDQPR
jgi:hypothetical protein